MRSSTSSSDPSRSKHVRDVVVFAVTFVLLFAATAVAYRRPPLSRYRPDVARSGPIPEGHYVAASRLTIDHYVLFHGLYDTLPHMQAAEVVFTGNSRMMYALQRRHLDEFTERTGLPVYVLGFGSAERNIFIERLIERHDLRPRFVVVNSDWFFRNTLSRAATIVVRSTRFEAERETTELAIAHQVRSRLHRVLPHLARASLPGVADRVIYRSSDAGDWLIAADSGTPAPVMDPALLGGRTDYESLEVARRFRDLLRARDCELVLTYVPTRAHGRAAAARMAEGLGVPFISPEVDGLRTLDGSHLDPASIDAWTPLMLEELATVISGD